MARLGERGAGSGYRDAVRQRRQGLSPLELTAKVRRREDVPGALEVPSTIRLGSSGHRLEGVVICSLIVGGAIATYAVAFGGMLAMIGAGARGAADLLGVFIGVAPYLGAFLGAFVGIRIRKKWRAARDAEVPRQRVLVLAPDGCIIGFRTGVKTMKWSEVGSFAIGPTEPDHNDGLVVRDIDGEKLGDIDGGWLDAPLSVVVKVAETYREAAL